MGHSDLMLDIEVAYARPDQQYLIVLSVPEETTVETAIALSGILTLCPEIGQTELMLGIFGERCLPDQPVKSGDRIEIYRPLLMDPKESRRRRAKK